MKPRIVFATSTLRLVRHPGRFYDSFTLEQSEGCRAPREAKAEGSPMSCRRHDDEFNGHLPLWGADPTVCQSCGKHYKWWTIVACDAQIERREIAEQRARDARPWWGPLLGVLFAIASWAVAWLLWRWFA